MSKETSVEKDIHNHYRVHIIHHQKQFDIGTFTILPLEMAHDVYCLGFLIFSHETNEHLFFATDTSHIKYNFPSCDYLMIEANYDIDLLNKRIEHGDNNMASKERLVKSHQSIDSAIKWLESQNLNKTKRIYLLHLSSGSADEKVFKHRVMAATGKPTTIC